MFIPGSKNQTSSTFTLIGTFMFMETSLLRHHGDEKPHPRGHIMLIPSTLAAPVGDIDGWRTASEG